jgi:hypothetical protein
VTLPANFTDEHRRDVCRIGQGAACCRYLTVGVQGWCCEKRTSLRHTLDARVSQMTAQGDNCDGIFEPRPAFTLLKDRFEHPAGTTIYRASGYDYGLASDDARATGVPHTSMTLEPSGDYPSFTVPDSDFAPVGEMAL